MNNPSAPVLDRATVNNCGCFAKTAPMPMGCAVCGHAPYAHGCPDRSADHEYVQPSAALMDTRLRVRRTGDRSLPCFEPPALAVPDEMIPLLPTQRSARQILVETTAPVAEQRPGERASAEAVAPVAGQRSAGWASMETAPPVVVPQPRQQPASQVLGETTAPVAGQRRPEQVPAAVPMSPLRRARCPLRPPLGGIRTGPPRLGGRRRCVPRTGRRTCAPPRAVPTLSPYRPPGPYGAPLHAFPQPMKRARPPLPTNRRALDRIEVQSMNDGRSTAPEPTTIPGWRLILSDAGRLWASREKPFSPSAFRAGAERTVDGDSLEALRAETDRQETFAREADEQAAQEQAAQEQEAPASGALASEPQEQAAREQEALQALAPKTREQNRQVIS